MKRKTVLSSDLAALVESTKAELTPAAAPKTPKAKTGKKRIPMARVFNDDGTILLLDGSNVGEYLEGFLALPPRSKAGYDNFWSNSDGFTNRQKFRNIDTQGCGKMLTVLMYQAARIVAAGGDEATKMEAIRDGIIAEWDTLLEKAVLDHKQDQLNVAYNAIIGILPDEKFPTDLDKHNEAVKRLTDKLEDGLVLPDEPAEVEAEDSAEADEELEGDVAENADELQTADA